MRPETWNFQSTDTFLVPHIYVYRLAHTLQFGKEENGFFLKKKNKNKNRSRSFKSMDRDWEKHR